MKSKIIFISIIFIAFFGVVHATSIPATTSKSIIAMDADSSIVLYNKDMEQQIYPASTTKILTAIISIENLSLDKSVIVSKTAINIPWDSSSVYLKEGEAITVKDLLYCLLLNSGNDAANVLAESVSGSQTSFVELMNKKAVELGCTSTHFNNAHGYSDSNHYTTALDMAKIFNYCIKNQTFTEIISTKSYIVNETNKTNQKRYLKNTNRLILQKEDSIHARYYMYCMGGKTGYTDEAGRTLITFAKKDDKTIIVGIFGATSKGSQDARYTDAINLFEYCFNNFTKTTVADFNNYNFDYININKKQSYSIGLIEDVNILLNNNSNIDISYTLNIDENKLNNLDNKQFHLTPVGTITFSFTDTFGNLCSTNKTLYLKGVNTLNLITSNIKEIITILVLFLAIVFIFLFIKVTRKKMIKTSRKQRRTTKISSKI